MYGVETLSRLEHAKHSPNVATVDKIVRTLEQAEASQPREAPASGSRTEGRWGGRRGNKVGNRPFLQGLRSSPIHRACPPKAVFGPTFTPGQTGRNGACFVSPDHGAPVPGDTGAESEAARRPANGRACSSPVGPMPPAREHGAG